MMMDFNRINKELRASMDQVSYSLEIDGNLFLNHPEKIQQERAELVRKNPVKQPEEVMVKDIFIKSSGDDHEIRLHIYQAENYDRRKVLLYFHGGGYVFGQPEQMDGQMFDIADQLKATIISVDYRLSPQYRFPVPVLDGFDALQWIISQGEAQLGVDSERITVFGASAGGHLAAAVTQMAADHHFKNIHHQFLLYPVIHHKLDTPSMEEFTDIPLWNKKYAETAWLHFLGKDNMNKSIRYSDLSFFDRFPELPRTTIVACELDPLRDEAIEYAQNLYKAGVKTELWVIPGALHVFDLFDSPLNEDYKRFLMDRLFQ
ncbi:MAG: alpha/beta hydrolase [Chryseobacterium sp.]|nr:alpha/beta hydrolase [Chryseobacterium sp.]